MRKLGKCMRFSVLILKRNFKDITEYTLLEYKQFYEKVTYGYTTLGKNQKKITTLLHYIFNFLSHQQPSI